jgi:hypothetical protein
VTIGTWNVAGRGPDEDLEIDDWLRTEEPADIYILGCVIPHPRDWCFIKRWPMAPKI